MTTKQKLENCYLEWFNDFLTIGYFATCHRITESRASRILSLGKRIHYRKHDMCLECSGRGHIRFDKTESGRCDVCNGTGKGKELKS